MLASNCFNAKKLSFSVSPSDCLQEGKLFPLPAPKLRNDLKAHLDMDSDGLVEKVVLESSGVVISNKTVDKALVSSGL